MTIKGALFGVAMVFMAAPSMADEIHLKEGKVLTGTITHEDANEVTIFLASNMYLRVSKNKVSKLIRVPKTKKSVARVEPAVAKSTAPSAKTLPMPTPVSPMVTPKFGIDRQTVDHAPARIQQAVVTAAWDHRAAGEEHPPRPAWTGQWSGTVEKENTQVRWKQMVIQSTITVLLPAPPAGSKPTPSDVENWNTSFGKAAAYVAGGVDIYKEAVVSFADHAVSARATDEEELRAETDRLFQDMQSKFQKKMDGYDRRTKNLFDKHTK